MILSSTRLGTNSAGLLTTSSTFTVKDPLAFISSTATDESNSNTSEFSNCVGTGGSGGGGSGTGIGVGPPGRIVRDGNIGVVRPPGAEFSRADLKISINATPTFGMDGISLSYNITVTNNGPGEAREVVVSDNLPEPLVFASCVSNGECGGAGNNRTVRFASLAPNSSATMTIIARVKTIAPGMQVNNTVRVNSQTPDPNPNDNTATATSTAPRLPF